MHKIDGAGHVANSWVAEDVPTNRPPTEITPDWMNAVQDELVNIVETAGFVLAKGTNNQVLAALDKTYKRRVAVAAGTVDALTADFTPDFVLTHGHGFFIRAIGANTVVGVTLACDGGAAKTIVKGNNIALVVGDIIGAGFWLHIVYDATLDKYVLLNPATGLIAATPDATTAVKGKVQLATSAEAQALTDALKAITPATLAAAFQSSNQSLAANGYQKLPGGLILQWGLSSNITSDASSTVTLPITFPNACLSATATMKNTTSSGADIKAASVASFTASQIVVFLDSNASSVTFPVFWFAIGY